MHILKVWQQNRERGRIDQLNSLDTWVQILIRNYNLLVQRRCDSNPSPLKLMKSLPLTSISKEFKSCISSVFAKMGKSPAGIDILPCFPSSFCLWIMLGTWLANHCNPQSVYHFFRSITGCPWSCSEAALNYAGQWATGRPAHDQCDRAGSFASHCLSYVWRILGAAETLDQLLLFQMKI